MADILINVKNISKSFGNLKALDNVSFEIFIGESLGLVGESGSGKTTLARIILKLIAQDNGDITYNIKNIRRNCQIVFQDPYTSLNPRIKIGEAISEPMLIHRICPRFKIRMRTYELLEMVGLETEHYSRYPHELSGGERQRVGIARALASNPKFIILDEPVSSLDLSIQVQVLDLLKDLEQKLSLTYLFIAHDPAVIKYICERTIMMKSGRII